MKWRYLRIGGIIWGKHEITKDILASVKVTGDMLVDLKNGTYFDVDNNRWIDLEGDR